MYTHMKRTYSRWTWAFLNHKNSLHALGTRIFLQGICMYEWREMTPGVYVFMFYSNILESSTALFDFFRAHFEREIQS